MIHPVVASNFVFTIKLFQNALIWCTIRRHSLCSLKFWGWFLSCLLHTKVKLFKHFFITSWRIENTSVFFFRSCSLYVNYAVFWKRLFHYSLISCYQEMMVALPEPVNNQKISNLLSAAFIINSLILPHNDNNHYNKKPRKWNSLY